MHHKRHYREKNRQRLRLLTLFVIAKSGHYVSVLPAFYQIYNPFTHCCGLVYRAYPIIGA